MTSTVHLANLDKAFALAHHASQDDRYTPETRDLLHAIATEIWLACAEPKHSTVEAQLSLFDQPSPAAQLIDSAEELS